LSLSNAVPQILAGEDIAPPVVFKVSILVDALGSMLFAWICLFSKLNGRWL
jgi:hypothetical protein